jgi:hypothetical protein
MGFVKQKSIERESKHLSFYIKDISLCSSHIDDKSIENFIRKNATKNLCGYCNKIKPVVELEELMEFMMIGILNFYDNAANYLGHDSIEFGRTFFANELILDKIGLEINNKELLEDIINSIDDCEWCDPSNYFDSEGDMLIYHWSYFKDVVKHKSRYLFPITTKFKTYEYKQNAYDIFKEIKTAVTRFKLISSLKVETKFYRVRQHSKGIKINEAKQISSPPLEDAIYPNRMSPAGISMFYCAFDNKTAMLETINIKDKKRPLYTSAVFKNKREIKVIDFTKLPPIPSIFDYKKFKDYYMICFLRDFVQDLSSNILHDNREHIEYVPTQIVTEYFRYPFNNNKKQEIEGIIYSSSKNKGMNSCVLFFDNKECEKELDFLKSELKTRRIIKGKSLFTNN